MKFNRILSLILMVALLLTMMPAVVYAHMIAEGDYVQFGAYNGEPIVWRVVRKNGGVLELISDKTVTIKAFDGAYAIDEVTEQKNGNSTWETSNIRTWLNSADASVLYNHLPNASSVTDNAYDTENGFLANFTDVEKSYLKLVSVNSALNDAYVTDASSGETVLAYDRDATTSSTNLSSAYVKTTQDYIYLPSVEDIEYIADNVYTFDTEYQRALPTSQAVANSDTTYTGLRTDNAWYYWLRDAMYGNDDSLVRCVTPNGTVEYAAANNGYVGVRPMCAISTENIGIESGDGSAQSPYSFNSEPWIYLDGDAEYEVAGTYVDVTVFKSNIPDNAQIKFYLNGSLYVPQYYDSTDSFPIEVNHGVNTVEAKLISAENKILSTAAFNFTGLEVQYTGTTMQQTFDDSFWKQEDENGSVKGLYGIYDGTPYSDDNWPDVTDGKFVRYIHTSDGVKTNVPELSIEYKKEGDDGITEVNVFTGTAINFSSARSGGKQFAPNEADVIMAEVTFKIDDFGGYSTTPVTLYYFDEDDSNKAYWSPLIIDKYGNLFIQQLKSGKIQVGTIEEGDWYNFKVIVNNRTKTATTIMDNLSDSEEADVLFYNEAMTVNDTFYYVRYFSTGVRGSSGNTKTVSFTDFNFGACNIISNSDMLGSIYRESGTKTVNVYVVNTTGRVLDADLAVAVYDKDRKFKEVKFAEAKLNADEGYTYDIVFEKTDIADTDIVKAFLFDDLVNIIPISPMADMIP